MKPIKFLLTVAAITTPFLLGCQSKSENQSGLMDSNGNDMTKKLELDGSEGEALFQALVDAGIDLQQNPNGLGADYLAARRVSCRTPVVPNPSSQCAVTKSNGQIYPLFQEKAKKLARTLSDIGAQYFDDTTGVSQVAAEKIECFRAVSLSAEASCTIYVQSASTPSPAAGEISLSGQTANDAFKAMKNAPLPQSNNGVGAVVYKAPLVYCSRAVAPGATTWCQFTREDGTKFWNNSNAAKLMFKVLDENGGRYSDGTVGEDRFYIKDLECSQAVVPQPQASCSYKSVQ